jgi:alkylhydroperoxidase family enzyme
VLEDWRSAPVEPHLKAMLAFLEKLTRDPAAVTSADVDPLRKAGLSDGAIEDAIHVSVLFHVYTRLADTFEFDIPSAAGFARGAAMLLKRGYA